MNLKTFGKQVASVMDFALGMLSLFFKGLLIGLMILPLILLAYLSIKILLFLIL
jgi:hypothetical protein